MEASSEKKWHYKTSIAVVVCILLVACQGNLIEKNQGVFSVDKPALKIMMKEKAGTENAFALALLDKTIENSVIEFKINADSIIGMIFFAGQTTVLNSKIEIHNDSMIIKHRDGDVYLVSNEKGLLLKKANTEMSIQMLKSEKTDLSSDTKEALVKLVEKEKELKEFTDNLGKWKKGNFVDDFGDKTEKAYITSIVLGSHENSAVVNSEVYIRTTIEEQSLYFQLFNKSMTLKESFPDSEFGYAKIKLPTGEVKTERIFFYKNTISEAPTDKNLLIYNHLLKDKGQLKISIDVSTASDYYSDRYQFTLEKNNLDEVIRELK